MTAAAIVVGIDAYPHLPKLDGSVKDALEVVDWLLEIGVAPDRIRLHLAPSKPPTLPAGITALTADRDAIWSSMRAVQQDQGGDTLYVFLSGHGYYLARSGPIFLSADWSADASSKNLDIHSYADFLQGLRFKNVLLVVDACQNLDVDSIYVSAIRPSPPDDAAVKPDPKNGLLLCCATEQEQYAPVIDGRGLLTRTLLGALRQATIRVPEAAGDAFVFDWLTGEAAIDLYPLFKWLVAPDVVRQAQDKGHVQRPTMKVLGRLEREWRFTACAVPVETVPLRVSADPLEGLSTIKITLTPPARALELPLTTTPPMPFEGFAPAHRRIAAVCTPLDDWEAAPPFLFVPKTAADVGFAFTLLKLPPAPDRDGFNLKAISAGGDLMAAFGPDDYDAAGALGAVLDEDGSGSPRMVPHETGPDIFENGASPAATEVMATRVATVLKRRASVRMPDVEIVTALPGQSWFEVWPNVRFVFPPAGDKAAVGLLRTTPMIRVEAIGKSERGAPPILEINAIEVETQSWRRLAPGPYRLVTEAPWGAGTVAFEVVGDERQTVEIPIPLGRPPLRNHAQDADIVLVPPPDAEAPAAAQVVDRAMTYLPPSLPLLMTRENGKVFAEPFSSLPWPEWDMLIGAGRLAAVDIRAAMDRIETSLEDGSIALFRLALAYAAWAQDDRGSLRRLITDLDGPYAVSMDAQLLRLALQNSSGTELLTGQPYFRWAYRLAQLHAPGQWTLHPPEPHSTWAVWELEAFSPTPERLEAASTFEAAATGFTTALEAEA
ncbi:MAG: hypothetical protein ACK4OJ_01865 [Brevundimonas sp.]